MTNPRRKKVLVVGVGSIGLRHARLCQERKDLAVEICDLHHGNLDAARAKLGELVCWSDLDAAMEQKPDLVIVATPHDQHERVTVQALEAGAHVLCEKPMAHEMDSATRMLEAHRLGLGSPILRIAFMLRFHPGVRRIRDWIRDGVLGTPAFARYAVGSYITLENSISRYQKNTFGAAVMDYAHGIDLIAWLIEQPPSGAYARGVQAGDVEFTSSPNVLSAILDYQGAFQSELHIDYLTKPQSNSLEIIGDVASASLDFGSGSLILRRRNDNDLLEETVSTQRDDIYQVQLAGFLDAIDGRPDDLATPLEGLQSVAAADAIIRSLTSGQREPVVISNLNLNGTAL